MDRIDFAVRKNGKVLSRGFCHMPPGLAAWPDAGSHDVSEVFKLIGSGYRQVASTFDAIAAEGFAPKCSRIDREL